MASAMNKGQATETPADTEKQPDAGKEQSAQEEASQQQGNNDYGRITDLYAYQSLADSAVKISTAVQAALDAANTPSKLLLLDDWNPLKGSAIVTAVDAALAFYKDSLTISKKAIDDSLQSATDTVLGEASQRTRETQLDVNTADFADFIANLTSLHDLLQPTVEYAARDVSFDADAVRSAVAGALIKPVSKLELYVPALQQIDMAGMPLMVRLQQATAAREALNQALANARGWIDVNAGSDDEPANNPPIENPPSPLPPMENPKMNAVKNAVVTGDAAVKAFDTYLEALLKSSPSILEQALLHQAAAEIEVTHLLAVKPVLAVSQTTNVRSFPLLNENKHFGASVLAYTLTSKDGRVRAAGITNAEKNEIDQPHSAKPWLVKMFSVVIVLLACSLLCGASALPLTGLKALITVMNPPIVATETPATTPIATPTTPADK